MGNLADSLRAVAFPLFSVAIVALCWVCSAQGQISSRLFAMGMNGGMISQQQPWPVVPFSGTRLWDSGAAWAVVNTSSGGYDWSELDIWMSLGGQHNSDLLYTFGRTPRWASSHPYDTTCANGPGQCDPPNDLNSDGTGTNQHWKSFVKAIATRAAGRIHYWEVWN